MSGYFFADSKPGGLTRKPCTSSLFAPLKVNASSGGMSICASSASFMCVTAVADLRLRARHSMRQISLGAGDRHAREKKLIPAEGQIVRVQTGDLARLLGVEGETKIGCLPESSAHK